MKKIVRRILLIGFVLLFTCSITMASDTNNMNPSNLLASQFEELLHIDQSEAIKAFNSLISNFDVGNGLDYNFPDDYAGCYIDSDANLIVKLLDLSYDNQRYYSTLCSSDVKFESAEYSYNFLYELYMDIQTSIDKQTIEWLGVSQSQNCIDIYVNDITCKDSLMQKISNLSSIT